MKYLKKEYLSDNSLSGSEDVENSQNSMDISQQNTKVGLSINIGFTFYLLY